MRLDLFLTENGYCRSRSEAQRAIRSGMVVLNGQTCKKCAEEVDASVNITLDDEVCKYVSRGGKKLEGALTSFGISVQNAVVLDIGASTGGFTDCLLQNGARIVYALENGCGQLHPSLISRADVVNMEHTNARYLTCDMFQDKITHVTMDVSFISQKLILPAIASILPKGGVLISLIKPQFEVGRAYIGKGGIVRDEKARRVAVEDVCAFAASLGFEQKGIMVSPILGGDGNTEYLAYFIMRKGADYGGV